MTQSQDDDKMPKTGEGWRHYKGGLYTIIGTGRDADGFTVVVYTHYGWSKAQLPLIFVQLLGRFLQDVENDKPRFQFEREAGEDTVCPFIRERTQSLRARQTRGRE